MGIFLAVFQAIVAAVGAYLGVHVTLHPPGESAQKIRNYKIGFIVCGVLAVCLIGIQAYRNDKAQEALMSVVTSIEGKVLMPNIPSALPPANAGPLNPPKEEERKLPDQRPGVKPPAPRPPEIDQHSEGPCSPNIVGDNNSTNCAPEPKLTATPQFQQKMPDGEWLTSFTVSPNVLMRTGDLRLLCDGPVLRAGISRINPAEFISGNNGPNPSNPNEVIYQLGPEMISPGSVVVVGVYSNNPVHVLSGSLGSQGMAFTK